MAIQSPQGFVSYSPISRARRARRHRLAALLVIAAMASSTFLLQSFYAEPSAPGAPSAFTYFPN